MKLATFSGLCDICGKRRGKGVSHEACSKKRREQKLPDQRPEPERLSLGHYAQKAYRTGNFHPE